MDILSLIGRDAELFDIDINIRQHEINSIVKSSTFLVLGGAGTIGQAVTREIFSRNPKKLHVVDISENNMVELVRDLRSSVGYGDGDFQTFALDIGSSEFKYFFDSQPTYDFILNLSALKHVRSEKDPFTLMRMIDVNIFNVENNLQSAIQKRSKKYFCVSTDKAANPVNLMGASKRIMEMFLTRHSSEISISMARFANVAFSDGSLLHGFNQRILKKQPLSAPNDVKRYFVTPRESGQLCLLSCLFGETRDIYFPKLSESLHLTTFADIAVKYLDQLGYEPHICTTEQEAREKVSELSKKRKWPCYFFKSDTSGEKDFEEFYTSNEELNLKLFHSIGVIKNSDHCEHEKIQSFRAKIQLLKKSGNWSKESIVSEFKKIIPEFGHIETGKYLDGKM